MPIIFGRTQQLIQNKETGLDMQLSAVIDAASTSKCACDTTAVFRGLVRGSPNCADKLNHA